MKRFILIFVLAIGIVSASLAQVQFIGHRGASYLAPENTLAAVNLAWELDADAAEIDIYLTKDNRVVVHHDRNTKRQTGVSMKVADSSSDDLRKLDAGSFKDEKYKGEKIPFLEEVVATIPEGKTLVVEIKCGSEVLPYVKKIVDASGKKDQIVFIAFGWQTILDTKQMMPDNKCYWLSAKRADVFSKIMKAAHAGLNGLDLRSNIIDQEMMSKTNALGLEMLCWTVDNPKEAKRLIDLGVAGITSNRPAWLKKQLGE